MVDSQSTKITGYRSLNEVEIALMNTAKGLGQQVGSFIDNLSQIDVDKRWLAVAKTDLQKGFMSLVRSIAKPESF